MEQRFLAISRAASVLVVASSLVVVFGWLVGMPTLLTCDGVVPMAFDTGLTFLALVSLMAVRNLGAPRPTQLLVFRVAGGLLFAWGVLSFLNVYFPFQFGTGRALMPHPELAYLRPQPGMGPASALNFAIFGLALLTFHSTSRPWVGEVLASLGGLIGLLALVGYLYGVPVLYEFGNYLGMSLPSSVLFCLLSLAYFFSRAEVGFMAVLASKSIAGAVARRLLPTAILIPVVLGWLHLLAEKYNLFSTGFGTALLILAVIFFFGGVTVISIHNLSRLEASAKMAEAEQARLETLRADASELLQRPAEMPALLQKVMELVVQRLDAAFARVWTLDSSGATLELKASAGQYTHLNGAHSRVPVGQYKIGLIAQERRPHVSNKVLGDPRVHNQEWVRREGMVAFAGFPLMREDVLLGVVALFARHKLSAVEVQAVESISNLLAHALARKRAEQEAATLREELLRANAELENKVRDRTAKLQETVGELEYFSYTITHDMRAPLRAMQGFSEVLLRQCADTLKPKYQDLIRRIIESAGRMDSLITDALNYSKIVREEFKLKPIDAARLLRGMVESYPQFHPPNAEISIEDNLPVVVANEAGLTQCFSNLLGNAVKFVAPGVTPKIRVWAEARQVEGGSVGASERGASEGADALGSTLHAATVRIWFEDNGIGIAKEYHEQIFKMFEKLSHSYEGTGIGLALVRKVVERMKGRVGVDSEEGKGSRFWLELRATGQAAVGPVAGGTELPTAA